MINTICEDANIKDIDDDFDPRLAIDDWHILDEIAEINDKIDIQSYILSDLNKNIYDKLNNNNTKYIIDLLHKSIKNNLINIITDNQLIKLFSNPAFYLSLAGMLTNISFGISNKILTSYTAYSSLLDKTINDNMVNYYYNKAFEIAYLQLINECITSCMPFILKINTLNFISKKSYSETITINIANDMLLVTIKHITYVFSKYYFLNNNIFQDKIKDILTKIIANITIIFMNGILEGAFYIILEK
jgi:hypothetical protein